MVFLLLIVVVTASSNAYDFWSQDPFERKSRPLKKVTPNPVVEEELKKPVRRIPEDSCDTPAVGGFKENDPTTQPDVKPAPTKKVSKTKVAKAEPKSTKDKHVKIVIHSTDHCMYCDKLINEVKPIEDKYEIEVVKHDGAFYTDYRRYVYSFPYTEFLYDGRVKLYRYGYMDLKTLEYILNNQLK